LQLERSERGEEEEKRKKKGKKRRESDGENALS